MTVLARREDVVVRASASLSVDLGSFPKSTHTKRFLKMVFTAFLLGAQHKKEMVWRTHRQACLLCPWARHLTGCLHLYVADRWPTRVSPDYNREVADQACHKRRFLATHRWQSALLVVGLPVTHDWFKMG